MINEALIDSLALHIVGNNMNDEKLTLSKSPIEIDDEIRAILSAHFITGFKTNKYYNFYHENGFQSNPIFENIAEIFENPDKLFDISVELANKLFDSTDSDKIKSGEFYVTYFKDCYLDGENIEAVGLFKTESKETFLKIYPTSENFILEKEDGISLKKIDKGCMIFNTEKDKGFLIAITDGIKDENYWCNNFLAIKPFDNSYTKTQSIMKVCKGFVEEKLPEDFEVNKADQIELLNRSVDYFKTHEVFDKSEFEQQVLQQPEIINSFRDFEDLATDLTFEIAPQAVKKESKTFKSVLKLDKNFHIYIHGDRSLIERGEEDGKKYYKIFYSKED